jgi:hypothetical protein
METNAVRIDDNFLSNDELLSLQHLMIVSNRFSWYYNNFVDYAPDEDVKVEDYLHNFQFTHLFYKNNSPASNYLEILDPILRKLNIVSLVRVKANLSTVSGNIEQHNFHIDVPDKNCTTAIFYLNSNNGLTVFEDGTVIKSVANRLIRFSSGLNHTGTTCTDSKIRCLINFNYFEKNE